MLSFSTIGVTVGEDNRSIRLEKGKELLETTDLNVSEISFEVGFNNPNYFARVFQEEFGVTPSEVRKA